jgi:hypothetical protein
MARASWKQSIRRLCISPARSRSNRETKKSKQLKSPPAAELPQATDQTEDASGQLAYIHEVQEAIKTGQPVVVFSKGEGAELARSEGIAATYCTGGFPYWQLKYNRLLKGGDIVLVSIDPEEQQHAERVKQGLKSTTKQVRIWPEKANGAQPPPSPAVTGFAGKHQYANSDPHGSKGKPQGPPQTTWIYDHPDQEFYLRVDKGIDSNGDRAFFQSYWAGDRGWVLGVKRTYAERKVPYQLCALEAALLANADTEVQITEGEKDAETLRKLGFVATTNPGGLIIGRRT